MERVKHPIFPDHLIEKVKHLSESPGCYLWKNAKDEVIYVGKALKLLNRVKNYLSPRPRDMKLRFLQKEIFDLEWIITRTEKEALILEATLIKKYNPKYNVRLKDDKGYPYICISIDEPYPMLYLSRNTKDEKKKYFGPYTDVKSTRDLIALIHKIFPIRKTVQKLPLPKPRRPCLNFHIKRCLAPCQGNVTEEEYAKVIGQVMQFLEGKKDSLLQELRERMKTLSQNMEYERAIIYRDMIESISRIQQRQTVVNPEGGDEDIIAFAKKDDEGQVVILEVRTGRLEVKKTFALKGMNNSSDKEIITSFIEFYYLQANFIPATIILPVIIKNEVDIIIDYISKTKGFAPKLRFPAGGDKKSLLKLAEKNAEMNLSERLLAARLKDQSNALKELKTILKLKDIPNIIECYDISHTQGIEPVASGVMFVDGKPYKSGYRHYKIRGYDSVNDPGMMHEVIARRLQRLLNEDESLPDLVVIDGGETQLARACEAAVAIGLKELPMVGLAKKREEIYFPGEKIPYNFDSNTPAMRLLRHIRDEAHRFGVTFHRKRRNKETFKSILQGIPDIGIERKKKILKFFSDKKKIEDASLEDLKQVPGIGNKLAEKIYKQISNSTS